MNINRQKDLMIQTTLRKEEKIGKEGGATINYKPEIIVLASY